MKQDYLDIARSWQKRQTNDQQTANTQPNGNGGERLNQQPNDVEGLRINAKTQKALPLTPSNGSKPTTSPTGRRAVRRRRVATVRQ